MTDSSQTDAFSQVFRDQELSIGLALPMLRSGQTAADFSEQLALAQLADTLGFRALWVRDVPLNSADYPDPVGHLDPWVFLGALAAQTHRIVLASGAIVLTLRHPLHIAKGALSINDLSKHRFILGLGSGDRRPEYAAFGKDTNDRRALYQRNWKTLAQALGMPSKVVPDLADANTPEFTLLPASSKPIPLLAVGAGGQSVDWIARNAQGWMTYHREPKDQHGRHRFWRAAVERSTPDAFRGFGVAMRLELDANPDAPASPISLGYHVGRRGLKVLLREMRASGTHHVSLSFSASARPLREVIEEIAVEVLPEF